MSNILNMRCPKCGDENHISILAEVWLDLLEGGTKAVDINEQLYTPHSTATCACGYWGEVVDFHVEDAVAAGSAA